MERRPQVVSDSNSPAQPGVAHSTRLIRDEFTDLRVSRQRKWQLRRIREGKCQICGKPPVVKFSLCAKHYLADVVYKRESARRRIGAIRHNDSKYQRVPE